MRILILHNKTATGSYAETLYKLLLQLLTEQNFIITETNELKKVQQANLSPANTALVFHTEKKSLSFFARLRLRSAMRKKGFTHFVQVADAKPLYANLPNLIITNRPENTTGKPLRNSILAVCSEAGKERIKSGQPDIPADQIIVIPFAADDNFYPVPWSELQAIKMQYTQGREYFLISAEGKTLHSFTELLKAFSIFKKWQHSSMKLVVTGRLSFIETGEWKEKISTYKFRDDVVLFDRTGSTEIVQVIAGAYVFIHVPLSDNDILPLLQATKCETPCLSFTTESIEEYFGESAILIKPNDYDQLAEKMILLYKDEALRSRLIAKGKEVSELYSKEKTFVALAGALSLPLH